jgi:hypothetical protein
MVAALRSSARISFSACVDGLARAGAEMKLSRSRRRYATCPLACTLSSVDNARFHSSSAMPRHLRAPFRSSN